MKSKPTREQIMLTASALRSTRVEKAPKNRIVIDVQVEEDSKWIIEPVFTGLHVVWYRLFVDGGMLPNGDDEELFSTLPAAFAIAGEYIEQLLIDGDVFPG